MEAVQVPELAILLDDSACAIFPYKKTFEQARHDPCFVLHTSGSTGLPAPVTSTHWSISTPDRHHLVAPLDSRPPVWGGMLDGRRRNYLAWPISSSSGIGAGLTDICFGNTTTVFGPSEQTNAEILGEMIRNADIDSASCTPGTLEELATKPHVLAMLPALKHIVYVGGKRNFLFGLVHTKIIKDRSRNTQEMLSLNTFRLCH